MRIQKLLTIATLLLASYGCENHKGTNTPPVSTPVSSPTPSPELQRSPATQLKASTQLKKSFYQLRNPERITFLIPANFRLVVVLWV